MTKHLPFHISMQPDEADLFYQRYLDEQYPELTIAGKTYSTSLALRKTDWVAYRHRFWHWAEEQRIIVDEGAPFYDD